MKQDRIQEIRGLFQILEQTAEIAEDSLLTETHKDGENRCISQFNKVLVRLIEINEIPDGLFDPLPEHSDYSEINIACRHLAAYLSEGLGLSADLKSMMTNILGSKFLENIGDEVKDGKIGDLIRKSMPTFLSVTSLDDLNESIEVTPKGRLILDADVGTIKIQTTEENKVDIYVSRSAQLKADGHATEILNDYQVVHNLQGDELHIHAKFPEEKRHWKKAIDRLDVTIELTVPQNDYDVIVKTGVGDISVTDVNGLVQGRTSRGELQFGNIVGSIYGQTGHGNVRLNNCHSDVRVETTGGNIEINDNTGSVDTISSGGNVRCTDVEGEINGETSGGTIKLIRCKGGTSVETVGGSIYIENDGPIIAKTLGGSIEAKIIGQIQGDSHFEVSGGDITVSLNSEIFAKLDARSIGGKIISEHSINKVDQERPNDWQLKGVINGDGPLLTLRNIGGDIHLKHISK